LIVVVVVREVHDWGSVGSASTEVAAVSTVRVRPLGIVVRVDVSGESSPFAGSGLWVVVVTVPSAMVVTALALARCVDRFVVPSAKFTSALISPLVVKSET
jgi:hypothetical protein